jgi:hypothetical protein
MQKQQWLMKRISKILLATLVVLSSFAFVNAAKQSRLDVQAWELNAGGDPSNSSDYSPASGSGNCDNGSFVCRITDTESSSNPGHPALTYGTPSSSNQASYGLQTRSEE